VSHVRVFGDGIRAQLRTLVAILSLLLVLVGITGVSGVLLMTRTISTVTDRAGPAAAANHAVLQDLTDAETGLRAWIATGNRSFLQPFHAGLRRLPGDQRRLRRLTSGRQSLAGLVAAQEQAARGWLDGYARTRLSRPSGAATIRPRLFMTGKHKFDRIRAANAQVGRRIHAWIRSAHAIEQTQLRWTITLAALISLLGAALGWAVGTLMAARISRPLVLMQQTVDRLAAGDSTARAAPTGPREVRKVAYALNAFADENDRVRALESQVVEQLRDLDRAKDDFLSTVSHELRTPLTSIAGYVELFADEFGERLSPHQTTMLAAVQRNVQRLRGLIEDLLTLSKAEAEAFRTSFDMLDLTHLTSDVAHDLRAVAAERGITISEVHPPRAMVLRGDHAQLSRALLNLVSNALKFSPDGGDVMIRVKQAGIHAHIEVTDHGIGIPAAEMPHLATRFYRASNAVDAKIIGTGLGLRIVQAIADNHGGRLELESVEGEGTTARLVLPMTTDQDRADRRDRATDRADTVREQTGSPAG
jgi:signal transduction histidine kinase